MRDNCAFQIWLSVQGYGMAQIYLYHVGEMKTSPTLSVVTGTAR